MREKLRAQVISEEGTRLRSERGATSRSNARIRRRGQPGADTLSLRIALMSAGSIVGKHSKSERGATSRSNARIRRRVQPGADTLSLRIPPTEASEGSG
jgi:hypothetical protein